MYPGSPATQSVGDSGTSVSGLSSFATPSSSASISSPDATDLQLTKSGTGFKDSTHWTTVLSEVTETNFQGHTQDETRPEAAFNDGSLPLEQLEQNVLLFEGCRKATDQELLDSLPSRKEADTLVALYFRAQEYRCTSANGSRFENSHECLLTQDEHSSDTPD